MRASLLICLYDAKSSIFRYNPFELGLADLCILPNKGCYTGQETVSRFSRSLIRSYYKHSSAANGDSYYLAHKSAIRSQLMAIKSLSLSERPISSKKNDKIFDQSGKWDYLIYFLLLIDKISSR